MPLDYVDFAHHYAGQPETDDEKRVQFAVFADVLDCIVRLYWTGAVGPNKLGITLSEDLKLAIGSVASNPRITITFNDAASSDEAGKQES